MRFWVTAFFQQNEYADATEALEKRWSCRQTPKVQAVVTGFGKPPTAPATRERNLRRGAIDAGQAFAGDGSTSFHHFAGDDKLLDSFL